MRTLLGTLLLAFGITAVASATATTHIWAPSTDVQPFGKWHITSDVYVPVETDAAGNLPASVTNIGLTVGVLPFETLNAEVGIDHKTGLGVLDRSPLYFNAKLAIPENAFGKFQPALAVGIFDLGTNSFEKATGRGTNNNVVYGKAAKTIGQLGRLSVGYFSGSKDLLLDKQGKQDNTGLLAAWERTITEVSDKLWLCAEYMGTESAYGTMNLGASWKFADNVVLLAGYDAFNNSNVADTFTLQVDIDFDLHALRR
jgi:hypothetical protein